MNREPIVFVTSTCQRERTDQFVDALAASELVVVSARDDAPGPMSHLQDEASAWVLAYGPPPDSDVSQRIRSIEAGGRLFPVRLEEPGTPLDVGLREFDLRAWDGGSDPEFARLVAALERVVRDGGLPRRAWAKPLTKVMESDWPLQSINELVELSDDVRRLGVLVGDDPQSGAVAGVLTEIGKTYRAVDEAIGEFRQAGTAWKKGDKSGFERLAQVDLAEQIHNRRGSCGQIESLYERANGLRASLAARTTPEQLTEIDRTFRTLGSADWDMFQILEEVGRVLSEEAEAISSLDFADQAEAARARVESSREAIKSLTEQVRQARRRLQAVQETLGYAESSQADAKYHVTVTGGNVGIIGDQGRIGNFGTNPTPSS